MEEKMKTSDTVVFIDTNMDTHLAMIVSDDDTVGYLKGMIPVEHSRCFPDLGEIRIRALKVERRQIFYHLSDSMLVRTAFDVDKQNWFLSADIVACNGVGPTQVYKGNLPRRDCDGLEKCKSKKRKHSSFSKALEVTSENKPLKEGYVKLGGSISSIPLDSPDISEVHGNKSCKRMKMLQQNDTPEPNIQCSSLVVDYSNDAAVVITSECDPPKVSDVSFTDETNRGHKLLTNTEVSKALIVSNVCPDDEYVGKRSLRNTVHDLISLEITDSGINKTGEVNLSNSKGNIGDKKKKKKKGKRSHNRETSGAVKLDLSAGENCVDALLETGYVKDIDSDRFGYGNSTECKIPSPEEELHSKGAPASNLVALPNVVEAMNPAIKGKISKGSTITTPFKSALKQQAVSNVDSLPSNCSDVAYKTEAEDNKLLQSHLGQNTSGKDDFEMKIDGNFVRSEPSDISYNVGPTGKRTKSKMKKMEPSSVKSHEFSVNVNSIENDHAIGSLIVEPGNDSLIDHFGDEANRETKSSCRNEKLLSDVGAAINPLNSPDVGVIVNPADKKKKRKTKRTKKSTLETHLNPALDHQANSSVDPSICSGLADETKVKDNTVPEFDSGKEDLGQDDLQMMSKRNVKCSEPFDVSYNGSPSGKKRKTKVKKMETSVLKRDELSPGMNYDNNDGADIHPRIEFPSVVCDTAKTNRGSPTDKSNSEMKILSKEVYEMKAVDYVAPSMPVDFLFNGDRSVKASRCTKVKVNKTRASSWGSQELSLVVTGFASNSAVKPLIIESCRHDDIDYSGDQTNTASKMLNGVEVQTEVAVDDFNLKKSTSNTSLGPELKQQGVAVEMSVIPNKRKNLRSGKEKLKMGKMEHSQIVLSPIERNVEIQPPIDDIIGKDGRTEVHSSPIGDISFVDYFVSNNKINEQLAHLNQDKRKETQSLKSDKKLSTTMKMISKVNSGFMKTSPAHSPLKTSASLGEDCILSSVESTEKFFYSEGHEAVQSQMNGPSIFNDSSSESFEESVHNSEDCSIAPADTSSECSSEEESVMNLNSIGEGISGRSRVKHTSKDILESENLSLDDILRRSKSYKLAKLSASKSQPEDMDIQDAE